MKYCRFLLDGQTHYGRVEERNGEPWIVGPAPVPEEDLRAVRAFHDGSPFLRIRLHEADA